MAALRKTMSKDKHIVYLKDYPFAKDCFTTVEIKGGVGYFLFDENHNDNCEIIVSQKGQEFDRSFRPLLEQSRDVIVRYSLLNTISQKISSFTSNFFKEIVSSNDPFGFDERVEGTMKRKKLSFVKEGTSDSIPVYLNGWRRDGLKYLLTTNIKRNQDWINSYKIFIPKSWGNGVMSTDRLSSFIPDKPSCCTETYLCVGPFATEYELGSAHKYMLTKFFHALVFVSKNTQNSMQDEYRFVPMQNFTEESDIDWSKSVEEIDAQLYAKYHLSDEEIRFIESMIKPM